MIASLDEFAAWAAKVLDTNIAPLRRISAGSSRAMYLVTGSDSTEAVLRVSTGGGPIAGAGLTLAREAEVYRALSGRWPLIPRFHGLHPSGEAFLMDKVEGTHELSTLSEGEQILVCDGLVAALAELHSIDTRNLDLPSLQRPENPVDHGLFELDFWEAVLNRLPGDTALGRCAAAILRDTAPLYDGPPALCHGDIGPKNFMFTRDGVTALVDWETAHLGDPHDDLALWLFRGHEWLGAAGDFAGQLRTWSASTGIAIDPVRLKWYRGLTILRWYIQMRLALAPSGSTQDRMPYLRLFPALDIKLADALAQVVGVDLGDRPVLEVASPPLLEEAANAMRADIKDQVLPALVDPEARRRAASADSYLSHFIAVDRYGADIRRADALELSALAATIGGHDPIDRAADGTRAQQIQLLRFAMRRGVRGAYLWPDALVKAIAPLTPIDQLDFAQESAT